MNLRQALYGWRDNEASKRGVELFRILPNTALDEIVRALPKTKEELTAIKGIKDAKYHAYGKTILDLVQEFGGGHSVASETTRGDSMERLGSLAKTDDTKDIREQFVEETSYTVSTYLDIVNAALWRFTARVKGEITSVKQQGSAVYMSMRDKDDNSTMNLFMWLSDYHLSGVTLEEGLEVIVEGKSEVYKPTGRLSFRAQTVELVGEGALKKAYDVLKKKFDAEGVFATEKKRPLPDFPEHIGLVTSKQGAVIHDFLNNLGSYGYKVRLTDARVEGIGAVKELLSALKYWKDKPIDVLVVIRGGGSLESLQAFNHELVVRAISEFPKPVICAIGHDKDVPLAQLAADHAPSTPTAATALLNSSWKDAESELRIIERTLIFGVSEGIEQVRSEIIQLESGLSRIFSSLAQSFDRVARTIESYVPILTHALDQIRIETNDALERISTRFLLFLKNTTHELERIAVELETHNPLRQLKLGYSILSGGSGVIRSVKELKKGDRFEARLADGTLDATITDITSPDR